VTCWLERVRNATLAFGYQIHNAGQLTLTGATEHGVVNLEGRPVRMPEARRDRLQKLLGSDS